MHMLMVYSIFARSRAAINVSVLFLYNGGQSSIRKSIKCEEHGRLKLDNSCTVTFFIDLTDRS